MTTTFDAIRAIIVRDFELPAERLQRDTLLEDIQLDSLSITELVFEIEDEFKITAGDKIPPFETLGDIADYVARLIAERDTNPRVAAKNSAAPAIRADVVATSPTAKRHRSGAKGAASTGKGALPGKRSRSARSGHGKPGKRTNGGAANNAQAAGSGRSKATRAAKRPVRAAPSEDVPTGKSKAKGKGSAGRGGARAR